MKEGDRWKKKKGARKNWENTLGVKAVEVLSGDGGVRAKLKLCKESETGRNQLERRLEEEARKSCNAGNLLTECQGRFHLLPTFPLHFSLVTQPASIKQASWIVIKLFNPDSVDPIGFSFLLISIPSLQTNRLHFLLCPGKSTFFGGFGWKFLESHDSTWNNNRADWEKLRASCS